MNTQTESTNQPGTDPMVDWMVKHQIPVTRQNYLREAYMGKIPEPWTAELEMELPEFLQE